MEAGHQKDQAMTGSLGFLALPLLSFEKGEGLRSSIMPT